MSNRGTSIVPEVPLDVKTGAIESTAVYVNRSNDSIPNVESACRPKYDQSPLGIANSPRTVTHASGTELSEKASVYSYISARDRSNFVRQLHGRCDYSD
jgi:hypothetical protein